MIEKTFDVIKSWLCILLDFCCFQGFRTLCAFLGIKNKGCALCQFVRHLQLISPPPARFFLRSSQYSRTPLRVFSLQCQAFAVNQAKHVEQYSDFAKYCPQYVPPTCGGHCRVTSRGCDSNVRRAELLAAMAMQRMVMSFIVLQRLVYNFVCMMSNRSKNHFP